MRNYNNMSRIICTFLLAALLPVFAFAEPVIVEEPASAPAFAANANCFDYYKYDGLKANISASQKTVTAGEVIKFDGVLENSNPFPIAGAGVFVKIVRKETDGAKIALYSHNVVDQFFAIDSQSVPAAKDGENTTRNFKFEWKAPKNLLGGDYAILSFVSVNHSFDMSGITSTDDVVSSAYDFTVESTATVGSPYFDKSDVSINGQNYLFSAFFPNYKKDEAVKIAATIVNPGNTKVDATLSWTAYNWDLQRKENIIEKHDESLSLMPGESKVVSYAQSKAVGSATQIVGELSVGENKSFVNIRFTRDGYTQGRLYSVGITKFPIKTGDVVPVYACYQTPGTNNPEGTKISLKLTDADGTLVSSDSVNISAMGPVSGYTFPFTFTKDYESLILTATVEKDGKVLDQTSLDYKCGEMGAGDCINQSDKTKSLFGDLDDSGRIAIIVITLIVLLGTALYFIKHKRTTMPVQKKEIDSVGGGNNQNTTSGKIISGFVIAASILSGAMFLFSTKVYAAAPDCVPTITLPSATPINYNSSETVYWNSTGAVSSSISKDGVAWKTGITGNANSGNIISDTVFTNTCTNADGKTSSVSATIKIYPNLIPNLITPTVIYGNKGAMVLTTNYVESCYIKKGVEVVSTTTTGVFTTTPLTATTTYKINCTTPTGTTFPVDSSLTIGLRSQNGSCSPNRNLCVAGKMVDKADTATQSLWSCTGIYGGTTANCSLPKVNASCGSAINTCALGTVAVVSDTPTTSYWSCIGTNDGINVNCSLPRTQVASCVPTINKVYVEPTNYNDSQVISWKSTGAVSASLTKNGVAWNPTLASGATLLNGYADSGKITSDTVFTNTCKDSTGKSASASLTVRVYPFSGLGSGPFQCNSNMYMGFGGLNTESCVVKRGGIILATIPKGNGTYTEGPLTADITTNYQCTSPTGLSWTEATYVSKVIPMNGSCGDVGHSCKTGTFSDVTDTATDLKWNCNGGCGGTSVNCSIPDPLAIPAVVTWTPTTNISVKKSETFSFGYTTENVTKCDITDINYSTGAAIGSPWATDIPNHTWTGIQYSTNTRKRLSCVGNDGKTVSSDIFIEVVEEPVLEVNPQEIMFTPLAVGDMMTKTITVKNSGGGSLSGTLATDKATAFSCVGSCSFAGLISGASKTFTISFKPNEIAELSDNLLVNVGGKIKQVPLYGQGTAAITGEHSLDFGEVAQTRFTVRSYALENVRKDLIGNMKVTVKFDASSPFSCESPKHGVITTDCAMTIKNGDTYNSRFIFKSRSTDPVGTINSVAGVYVTELGKDGKEVDTLMYDISLKGTVVLPEFKFREE